MNGSAVPITPCAAEIGFADGLQALPAEALALFAGPGEFYATPGWYETLIATALPEGASACFALIRLDQRLACVFPLLRHTDGRLGSLTSPYSCLYRPLAAEGLGEAGWYAIGRILARHVTFLRLEALAADMPGMAALCRGFRAGGKLVLTFAHFGNWHEDVAGRDWQAYLAGRPGALRQTVQRRSAKLLADPQISVVMLTKPCEIEPGIAGFEAIYQRSWKRPEPHPRFNAACIRLAAGQGVLRLALLSQGEVPVAVQLWVVSAGRAQVLKLAHDEQYRAFSPGTVLTGWVIRRLLEEDGVVELYFGRGDDPYKQGWASRRRQRVGLVLASPWTASGLLLYARHMTGLLRRKMQKTVVDINPMASKGG
jgi:hypothetical protein